VQDKFGTGLSIQALDRWHSTREDQGEKRDAARRYDIFMQL